MIRIDTLMDEIFFAVTNTLTLQAIKAIDARDVLMDVEIFSTIYWQYRKTRDDYDVMNRFGHCVSCNFVEGLETEQAIGAVEESKLLPESLLRRPDLNTGVAFDNFDLFVETLMGKDTLYYTVGIVAQEIPLMVTTFSIG
jgi:hypothetical protein